MEEESTKICPLYFTDYDKISDTLIRFDRDITLKFNVQLSYQNRDGYRTSFHGETIYDSSKYKDTDYGRSIRRNMSFYFTIDDASDMRASILIGLEQSYLFKVFVEQNIFPWYFGNDNIYGTNPDDGSLIVNGTWKPERFTLNDIKYLEFYPVVVEMESGKTLQGIRMCINRTDRYVDMLLGRFIALYQLISYTDMYNVACSMVNYVKTSPYGMNVYDMRNARKTNFFDKI